MAPAVCHSGIDGSGDGGNGTDSKIIPAAELLLPNSSLCSWHCGVVVTQCQLPGFESVIELCPRLPLGETG